MKQKVLFLATVLRGHILVFHLPYMQWFQEQGYEVHVCARNDTEEPAPQVPWCDRYIDIPFERSPLNPRNIGVYHRLKKLIQTEKYVLLHCHTPVGGMLGRLSARAALRNDISVVYTAHGFHFFKGAKLLNWILFYPVERWLAGKTDLLITINCEDYSVAKKFKAKQAALVHGVGIELSRFAGSVDRAAVRTSMGIKPNAQVVIVVGEHIARKNHEAAIRAIAEIPAVHLVFCGVGALTDRLIALAKKLNAEDRIHFLGFREDIPALLKASDVFLFPSFQEGLPVSLMEAMAAGLPCAASCVRGNADLIRQGEGGMLRKPDNSEGFAQDVTKLLADEELRGRMGEHNLREIQAYGLEAVREHMAALYREQLAKER